ncbi:MAG: tetratricopeptide repeat protein, partial [Gammaproteobacteria bacterium]
MKRKKGNSAPSSSYTTDADNSAALRQAIAEHKAGRLQDAERLYREVLAVHPDYVPALQYYGMLANQTRRHDLAVQLISKAVSLSPNDSFAHSNLGNVLQDQGHLDDAIASYRRAIEINPDHPDAHNNLGNALKEKGLLDEALDSYQRAIEIDPGYLKAHSNQGNALTEQGRLQEAIIAYRRALVLDPGHAGTHSNLATTLLLAGDFPDGWEEYEWRWQGHGWVKRSYGYPVWDGASLQDKTLLVLAEQGIGDEIMFASCFPDLLARVRSLIIQCDPRLAPLFQRSFPDALVHGGIRGEDSAWLAEFPAIDVEISAGSIPRYLRSTVSSFPRQGRYLIADPMHIEKWRSRYRGLGRGITVGISWRGGQAFEARKRLVALHRWRDVVRLHDVQFIN